MFTSIGTPLFLAHSVISAIRDMPFADWKRAPVRTARAMLLIFARCGGTVAAISFLIGWAISPHLRTFPAPDRLIFHMLIPCGLILSGMAFILLDGIPQAEHYAADVHEGGFQFLLDMGVHPLGQSILPRILGSGLALGFMAASAAAAFLFGLAPGAVIGSSTHPAITASFGEHMYILLALGFFYGLFAGYAALLAGLTSSTVPGVAARMYVHFTGIGLLIFCAAVIL